MNNTKTMTTNEYLQMIYDRVQMAKMLLTLGDIAYELPDCRHTQIIKEATYLFCERVEELMDEWEIPDEYFGIVDIPFISEEAPEKMSAELMDVVTKLVTETSKLNSILQHHYDAEDLCNE